MFLAAHKHGDHHVKQIHWVNSQNQLLAIHQLKAMYNPKMVVQHGLKKLLLKVQSLLLLLL